MMLPRVGEGQIEAVPFDHTMFDFQTGETGMEFKRHGALPDTRPATNEKNLTLHVHHSSMVQVEGR